MTEIGYGWILKCPELWVTLDEFNKLGEYSTTLPTGKTIGKRWKRQLYMGPHRGRWLVGEYVEHADPESVGIKWYRLACAGDSLPDPHNWLALRSSSHSTEGRFCKECGLLQIMTINGWEDFSQSLQDDDD